MNEEENLTPEEQGEEHEEEQSTARGHSVFPYLAVLFATAFLLLLFAYLMQQRDSEEIMGNLSDLRESMGSIQSIDQLVEENSALREEIDRLKETEAEIQRRLDSLDAERKTQEKNINELTDQLAEQEETQKAWTAAVLFLEQMEHLVNTNQLTHTNITPDQVIWMEDPLAQIDQKNSGSYPEGWPTLTERYQALIEAMEAEAEE